MNVKICLSLLLLAGLCACSEKDQFLFDGNSPSIVGGSLSCGNTTQARHLVWVADEAASMACTGTIIGPSLILTAAHCVGDANSPVTLAFGATPTLAPYVLRTSEQIVVHPQYNKANSDDRNDLAIIKFTGKLPAGYTPANLPSSKVTLKSGSRFTAYGYGRITGKKSTNQQDMQGAGVLRMVDLSIDSFSENNKQFRVDQSKGQGICSGDSGGPALVQYLGADYVIGVASAILWTVPQDLSDSDKKNYLQQKDYCTEKSIYINLIEYLPWITEVSDQLLN